MAANGISTLETKQLRQIAKLDLAAINRAADGNARPYYDLTQLPTQYDGNTIVDNENAGGLVVGRPWVATDPTPSIITEGLVLHLDAGNPLSYSGTGTTWTDLSPSGKNATLGAAMYYSAADSGSLIFTGGSNGIATVASASSITGLTNNMTIEVWYKSQGNVTPRLLSTGVGSDGICFGSGTANPTKFKVTKYGLVDLFAGSIPQETNKWHQAVVVYSSTGGTKVYVDGALSETLADTQDIAGSGTPSIIIGKLESAYHKGEISIVRWYNAVLSDAQVLQNYTANIGRYALQPAAVSNLVLYYDPTIPSNSINTSATFLYNLGATALTATLTNVTWTKPYVTYNGTSSSSAIADSAVLEPGSSDFAIEAWIYHSTITGSTRTIISKTDNGGLASNWSYGLRTAADGSTYFEVGNGTTSVTSPAFTATTGTWYQVVGVWTNTAPKSIALYKNGELVGSNSHTFTSVKNSTRGLYLGNYNGGEYSQWFNGRMGVVRQYNKALSGAEVLQNYNNDRGLYGL
jgi:hypothetical protein